MSTPQERYFEKTLKACATMLARWKDASAVMWELTSSHKSLRLLLTRGNESGANLLLSCLDPIKLRGPIRWEHSDLSVSRAWLPESQEDGFLVVDDNAGVEILCGAVEVSENVKLY
jgi:hypothetical protein